jgi:hypothetical protein
MGSERDRADARTGAEAPAEIPERWSAQRQTDLVLRLLRGEAFFWVASSRSIGSRSTTNRAWRAPKRDVAHIRRVAVRQGGGPRRAGPQDPQHRSPRGSVQGRPWPSGRRRGPNTGSSTPIVCTSRSMPVRHDGGLWRLTELATSLVRPAESNLRHPGS